MKLKKQKRHRRAVRFYTACFGFRQPYKVLCDGTFVHHLIVNDIAPADKALSNILGGPVKLFTTRFTISFFFLGFYLKMRAFASDLQIFCWGCRCVLAELKRLGSSHAESLQAAYQLLTARCDHESVKSADSCITDIIGENNPEHFFTATQDTDIRKKLQLLPGVPLIFGLRNALFLEPPSAFQRQFVKNSEEERLHMTDKEYKMLKERTGNLLQDEEARDSEDEDRGQGDQNMKVQPMKKTHNARNRLSVKDRPQFKRKKAKAPNPLSVKKKKKSESPNPVVVNVNKNAETPATRSRKRKRPHRSSKMVDTSN
ncbi:hypothetical protein K2173_008334 [Erythroxylum novogranatense]|uniref:UTP23 sensor motif region domain-containing protein n=1 Tax=Erythroxylum novogranatense TaxID=1862640 RepID=A0AAV8TIV1_9ROSI|nr:hypothetical protein K2173_008334 [Erythroxylum novogranatense]